MKTLSRIVFLFVTVWAVVGFGLSWGENDSMVPLIYVLIAVIAFGFLILSQKDNQGGGKE